MQTQIWLYFPNTPAHQQLSPTCLECFIIVTYVRCSVVVSRTLSSVVVVDDRPLSPATNSSSLHPHHRSSAAAAADVDAEADVVSELWDATSDEAVDELLPFHVVFD